MARKGTEIAKKGGRWLEIAGVRVASWIGIMFERMRKRAESQGDEMGWCFGFFGFKFRLMLRAAGSGLVTI